MRRKPAYFVLTVMVVLAAYFVERQGALNSLRADNDALRRQVDSEKSEHGPAFARPPAISQAGLSEADEKELLQLRSRIVPLRQQLRDMSNEVEFLNRPSRR